MTAKASTALIYEVTAPPGAELCVTCNHQTVHHGYNGCFHTRVYSDGAMKMSMICSCEQPWGIALEQVYGVVIADPPAAKCNTQPLATLAQAIKLAFADSTFARGALLEYD